MQTYILKRLLLTIPMLLGISFVTFFVMQLAPGEAGQVLELHFRRPAIRLRNPTDQPLKYRLNTRANPAAAYTLAPGAERDHPFNHPVQISANRGPFRRLVPGEEWIYMPPPGE